MLFTIFFSPNIILFLSNQLSISLSSIFTNFSNEVKSSPEARSAVSSAKTRVFKFEAF